MAFTGFHSGTMLLFFLLACFLSHGSVAIQVTGAPGGVDPITGQRPFRYEIDTFAKSGPAFDLFILAMQQLQAVNQSDQLSYFAISGIHGFPQIPWDNVPGRGSYPGYCLHAATPFPIWHRPYVALFEQVLWSHAQEIAKTYPDDQRSEYQAAAITLRVPYWDWAVSPKLPDIAINPKISINTPTGFRELDNPMFNYTFQSDAAGNGFPSEHPLSHFPTTVRWWSNLHNQSNQTAATNALTANGPTILSMTYQLFSTVTNYTQFSCTFPGGQRNVGNNIENIHNSIHDSTGGAGHMEYPELAGFDPIFWLHHTMVDRLFAMWQALNPDSYVEPTVNAWGSYTELVGFVDSDTTALAPFHSDNGTTFFTPDRVRSPREFGYSYPELPDWNMTDSELAKNIRTEVNRLYNPTPSTTVARLIDDIISREVDIVSAYSHVSFDYIKTLGVNNLNMHWSIIVQLDRYAYNTSFSIYFFMGDAPKDSNTWPTAPNLIGSHGQFIAANVSYLHPDGPPSGSLTGEVSLTHTLAAGRDRGALANLEPDAVVPLLAKGLNWRARTPDGTEIDVDLLSGLSIGVYSRSVDPTTSTDEFPKYGIPQWQPNATQGKPGAAKQWYRLPD